MIPLPKQSLRLLGAAKNRLTYAVLDKNANLFVESLGVFMNDCDAPGSLPLIIVQLEITTAQVIRECIVEGETTNYASQLKIFVKTPETTRWFWGLNGGPIIFPDGLDEASKVWVREQVGKLLSA